MSRDMPKWLKEKMRERDAFKRMQQAFPSEQARRMALYGVGTNELDGKRRTEGQALSSERQNKRGDKGR